MTTLDDRYEIIDELGRGGMATVYRARDRRHGRDVAVKVMLPQISESIGAGRFLSEIAIAARLQHPQIVPVFDSGEAAGQLYFVMPLIDGESLRSKIERDKQLPTEEAVRLIREVAEALEYAHGASVLHRDLKPENILLSRGHALLADFGIARATLPEGSERATQALTQTGTILGTPAYMSPEQAAGERQLGPASDVYSLGCVLFELLTGEPPFTAATLQESLAKRFTAETPRVRSRRADTPAACDAAVAKAMARDPAERFASALAFAEALGQCLGQAASQAPDIVGDRSIAVVPFANLSPEPDTEYFSDGLTDEIITDLSRVRSLRVISRSSAMRFKGDTRGLAAIGRDLACRYVLEGSVRRAATTLRITARLVDAPNDVQLWADKYGGTLDDVFDIQERVSRSIVDALEIRLTPQEAEQLAERRIADVRAHECFLRAQSEIWSFLPGSVDKAISHLEAALELIGDNAVLYQGLGVAYFQYVNIGIASGKEEEYLKKAEWCADKIFALESESPRGYLVRANVQLARGDIHGCGRCLRRVLQSFPNEVPALQLYTHVLGWLVGKPEAAALAARLMDVDPLNAMSLLVIAMAPLFAGRFSDALEPARRMFALDPVTPVWRANYVMALSYNQRLDEAEALTEGVAAQPDSDVGTWWMGLWRAAWRGNRPEVLRLANGPYQRAAAWDAEIPWVLASAHAAVGAKDEALFWLDRAIERGMINYPFLSEHDPYLANIRGEARFGHLMERARREWERFEV